MESVGYISSKTEQNYDFDTFSISSAVLDTHTNFKYNKWIHITLESLKQNVKV